MSFKIQTNLDRKSQQSSDPGMQTNSATAPTHILKDEKLIESLRKLVREYIEIVISSFYFYFGNKQIITSIIKII
jgi:hypothetical protein